MARLRILEDSVSTELLDRLVYRMILIIVLVEISEGAPCLIVLVATDKAGRETAVVRLGRVNYIDTVRACVILLRSLDATRAVQIGVGLIFLVLVLLIEEVVVRIDSIAGFTVQVLVDQEIFLLNFELLLDSLPSLARSFAPVGIYVVHVLLVDAGRVVEVIRGLFLHRVSLLNILVRFHLGFILFQHLVELQEVNTDIRVLLQHRHDCLDQISGIPGADSRHQVLDCFVGDLVVIPVVAGLGRH